MALRGIGGTAGIAVALVLATTAARAESLNVVIPQKGFWDSLFVEFGQQQGFFDATGLHLTPTYTSGGAESQQAVVSGSADIAVNTGFLSAIAAYVKGAPVRVIAANLTSLQSKRDAITRFIQGLMRSIDWAYNDPSAIDEFAKEAGVSRAIAEKTRDEFFPQAAFKPDDIRGVDLVLQDAYKYKYIPTPMTPDQVKGMFDIVYHP